MPQPQPQELREAPEAASINIHVRLKSEKPSQVSRYPPVDTEVPAHKERHTRGIAISIRGVLRMCLQIRRAGRVCVRACVSVCARAYRI